MTFNDILIHQHLEDFLNLCRNELELTDLPEIYLVDQGDLSGTAFGEFDGRIRVVVSGRHPIDVFRTLAHELVHWKQSKEGMHLDGSDGSSTENQANSVAGIIMRKFGRTYSYLLR